MSDIEIKQYTEKLPKWVTTPLETIMYNRGITTPIGQEIWLKADCRQTYGWEDLDDDGKMQKACKKLFDCVQENKDAQIIVDPDCDGWNSSAILINYLYSRYPKWTREHCSYLFHTGKQHGMSDMMDRIDCDLLISPDGGTNDFDQQQELVLHRNMQVIVLDHHQIDNPELVEASAATIINVQNSAYPNKALTGGGVAYRFVSAFEDLYVHGPQPTEFMDLCAVANIGDMADAREPEIRAIVREGLSNIKNPFLFEMCKQHKYTLDKRNGLNYRSVAFAIVPFINALTRSGTPQEQEQVFRGMLTQYAFDDVDSSKRGFGGSKVKQYQEAVTIADRVKRRQDKLVKESVERLERKIKEQNLLDNSIILLLCEPDEIEAAHCGLVANKIQAKYQRPTLVLRRVKDKDNDEYYYSGSGRNYSLCPIEDMRKVCEDTGEVIFAQGHNSAFGVAIFESRVPAFVQKTNEVYKDVDFTPVYWVDYIWKPSTMVSAIVLAIAEMDIWGQEMQPASVAIEDIPLSENNVQILGLTKGRPTIKIGCGKIELMLFGASEELYEKFVSTPNATLTVVGSCSKNEWNGVARPQILIDDYEFKQKWIF